MKSLWYIIAGLVLAGFGAVFTVQGLGYLSGSPMTGDPLWAILGPIIVLIGIVLIVLGARRKRN